MTAMRQVTFILIFLLGIIFLTLSFSELEEIAKILRTSDLRFLIFAIGIQGVWALNQAATYRALYQSMGIQESQQRLFLLASAANFINIIAPSGGMGGMAVFINDAGRRGYSRGLAAAANALYLLLDYVAFLCVLTLGLIVLVRRNKLEAGEITASIVMFGFVLGFGTFIYIGSRSAQKLGNLLAALVRLINKITHPFMHRPYLQEERSHAFADEIAEGLSILRGDFRHLTVPATHALANKTLQIGILMLTFLNFHTDFSAGTLIAGFSIA